MLLLVSLGPPAVKQVLVRYLTLGDLQTTFELSCLGCGPTNLECGPVNLAQSCVCAAFSVLQRPVYAFENALSDLLVKYPVN